MNFRPMLLAAGLLASAAAHALSTTAQITAESALLSLQLAAKQRAARGLLPPEQAACFQALQPSDYTETVEKIVNTALSPAELAAADQFFNSPPGRKYARHGLLGTYTAVGETPPEPLPEISADEGRAIEAFIASPVGRALLKRQVLQTLSAREALDRRGQELVARCKAVKPARSEGTP